MTALTADWLAEQRWFAGKGDDTAPGAAPATAIAAGELEITLVDVGDDRYQLVSDGNRPDSLDDPATGRALLAALRAERAASGPAGEISFHLAPAGADLAGEAVRPLGAEQSNTSLVVDDRWILKVFRRIRAGSNPELEVLRFLTEHGAPGVPRVAGWYEAHDGGAEVTLGVLQSLVADTTDGWTWTLDRLRAEPEATIGPLHELGAVIADLHRTLAQGTVADGFGTVAGKRRLARSIAAGIAADAHRIAASLPVGSDADEIRAALDGATALSETLAEGLDAGDAIRVHGDLHLGQVLRGPEGWTVIDWEGEPSRPIEERRSHQPALRDLAGLLRSLSYAAETARRDGSQPLDGWTAGARAALIDGYLSSADPALLPSTAVATRDLLVLLELEKVVYEIGYELANRPAWLSIPTNDLFTILGSRPA